ncbi:hypothetical protein CC86DRAFT_383571 [Ophiobolus disseminans]|uniref:F-box domain-containing protein n=1 Tax=Ophiobolus disseminans TaxID=1469910 RepID=A0A6A6ZVM8_9PLEO|nr:hypothetical protein CC86DRAFT_383571 [Ophiobolus disseminans]
MATGFTIHTQIPYRPLVQGRQMTTIVDQESKQSDNATDESTHNLERINRPKFYRFIDLPEELRLEILRFNLTTRRKITARMHTMIYGAEITGVSSVNKYIYSLAVPLYYGENEFSLFRELSASGRANISAFRMPPFATGSEDLRSLFPCTIT